MKIAICEDDTADAAKICKILNSYIEQNGYTGEISVFKSGEELLGSFFLGLYDVIFLDIYMAGLNGIATAKKIRTIDPTCALIFITSSRNHSLESYSVRGSAYVLKPIGEEEMRSALFTCREIFIKNARYIKIRANRTDIKIPLIKISYVESLDQYALFHTADGEYKTRMTLDEIEKQMGGNPFCRCHQSYLINSNHILKLDGNDVLMKNGDRVPMRKVGRNTIREKLADTLSAKMFEV